MRPPLFAGLVHDEAEARRSASLAHGQEPVLFRRQGKQGFGRRAGGEELDARFNLPDQPIFVGQHGDPGAGMAVNREAKAQGGKQYRAKEVEPAFHEPPVNRRVRAAAARTGETRPPASYP